MSDMFCFQCQQTAGNKGCTRVGVCGKQPETANLQDELVCELIYLAEAAVKNEHRTKTADRLLIDGLFTTLTNVNFDNASIRRFIDRVVSERKKIGGAGLSEIGIVERGNRYCIPPIHTAFRNEGHGCLCSSQYESGL